MQKVYTQEQRETLEKATREMINSFYRAQAEKDLQKEICSRIKEEIEMSPRFFRKLAKTIYDNEMKRLDEEVTELLDIAEELGYYTHNEG